jgi:hypothetical protein
MVKEDGIYVEVCDSGALWDKTRCENEGSVG